MGSRSAVEKGDLFVVIHSQENQELTVTGDVTGLIV
jgi:hypothetical protein